MIEIRDDLGTLVRIDSPAQRVVCLVPSITETLFALGAGDQVVGITDFCIHPAAEVATKNKLGGTKNIAVEKVFSLHPDLVIANAEENRKHQIERLRRAGISVFVTFPKTVDGCLKMMRDVAALTARNAEAAPILDSIAQARLNARSEISSQPVRVLCPIWKDPYMTINRDTFVDAIIRESGGRNVFENEPERYPRFTLSEAGSKYPEVIILPTEPYHFCEADKADFESLGREIPAIRNGHIHVIEGELLSWYGPRVPRALRELSALLRPSQ